MVHLILIFGALGIIGSGIYAKVAGHSWARIGALRIFVTLFYVVLIGAGISLYASLMRLIGEVEAKRRKKLARGMALDAVAVLISVLAYILAKRFL
jgi:hypothetical protein